MMKSILAFPALSYALRVVPGTIGGGGLGSGGPTDAGSYSAGLQAGSGGAAALSNLLQQLGGGTARGYRQRAALGKFSRECQFLYGPLASCASHVLRYILRVCICFRVICICGGTFTVEAVAPKVDPTACRVCRTCTITLVKRRQRRNL